MIPIFFYNSLIKELNKKGFDIDNDDHILVLCGVLFDRGPDSIKIYNYIKSFPKERRIQ